MSKAVVVKTEPLEVIVINDSDTDDIDSDDSDTDDIDSDDSDDSDCHSDSSKNRIESNSNQNSNENNTSNSTLNSKNSNKDDEYLEEEGVEVEEVLSLYNNRESECATARMPPHELPTTMTWKGYRFTVKERVPYKNTGS